MATRLPYLSSPGTIKRALDKIKIVPTPPKVTQDFVKTKLQIRGGPGDVMASYLKKIGFANADGTPSDLYVQFRNPASSKAAVAQAFRIGYAALYDHNEYAHEMNEQETKGLIIQITGCAEDARTLAFTRSCIKSLKEFADFEDSLDPEPDRIHEDQGQIIAQPSQDPPSSPTGQPAPAIHRRKFGMNLSYTINLNLPPSSDIAVFNAIFKSLKENILEDIDEQAN